MKERLRYVDISRAIAIIVIVIGHTLVHSEHCSQIFKLFYSFNIILFLILSGFTYSTKDKFKDFCKKKFFRLMIPYFVWAILFIIPLYLFGGDIGSDLGLTSSFSFLDQIKKVFYGIGINGGLKQNTALWFLPALFTTEILFYYIEKICDKKKNRKFIILILFLLIGFISTKMTIYLPWGINTFLNIGVVFWFGYILKDYLMKILNNKNNYLITVLLLIVGVIFAFINKTVFCVSYEYGNYLFMLIAGISISLSVILLSANINSNNILEYVGKNTMGILIFHKIIILIFQTKLGFISSLLRNSNIFIELLLTLIVSIISVIVSIICTNIIKKIIPEVMGDYRKRE